MSTSRGFTYIYRQGRWIWFFRVADTIGGLFHRPQLGIPDLSDARSIVVLKLDQVGDLVLTQPLLAALRKTAPEARIEIVVGKDRRQVAEQFPEVDAIHELPVRLQPQGPRFNLLGVVRWVRAARARRPDITVAAKEEPFTVLLAWLLGSPVRIGFREGGLGFLLTHTVPVTSEQHQSRVLADLAGPEGKSVGSPRFALKNEDHAAAASVLETLEVPAHLPLVVVHPGAGSPDRQWPWEYFVETMRQMSRKRSVAFLVVWGAEDELSASENEDVDSSSWLGRLSDPLAIGPFAALLARADLLLGNESAPSHIAAAVGTPSIVPFFSNADPHRWGPAGRKSRVIHENGALPAPDRVVSCMVELIDDVSSTRRIRGR